MKQFISRIFPIAFLLALSLGASAQTPSDPVIFEVGGQKIYKSEFMKEFLQSIGQSSEAAPTACTYEKRKALEDYVDLFVNFRAKLTDAYALQFDTLYSLKKELKGYRAELASPYLIDSGTMTKILHEAYDRNHYVLHASHILIKCDQYATIEDTLEAYNRAMDVYKKAISGENFSGLATKYSDDPSAKGAIGSDRQGNGGDLGCFTVFNMVYPFECAAYNLKPGEISRPIRTKYGYHIIKLHEKLPYFGKATIQHIWVRTDKDSAYAAVKIKEAYQKLKDGENFASVVKNYSDDRSTSANGGMLPNMEASQMPVEYVKAITNLNPGEFSTPIRTSYGWHIVALVNKQTIPSYEDMVPYYKQRLTRDQRNTEPQSVFVAQCKKKYPFTDYTTMLKKAPKGSKKKVYLASLDQSIAAMNDSVYRKKWHYKDSMITDMRPLCFIGDKEYTNVDLLKYIDANQTMVRDKGDYASYINERYQDFIDAKILEYADSRLEIENAEFKELMDEYRNGLIIFAYNDKMVWSKAITDTTGLKQFYATESPKRSLDNTSDEVYFWNTRANVSVITIADSAILSPNKAKKIVAKCQNKGINNTGMLSLLQAAVAKKDSTAKSVKLENQIVEQGHQSLLTDSEWKRGTYEHAAKKGYQLIVVEKIMDPCLKTVMEARGYYINDYQNYLDAELVKQLRAKYNVVVHQNVVDEITY